MRSVHFLLIVVASIAFAVWSDLLYSPALHTSGDRAAAAAFVSEICYYKVHDLARYVVFVSLVLGHAVCFPTKRSGVAS
jgi:hypothetical protein